MLYYGNRELMKRARDLRNHSTPTEIILWSRLRSKQTSGYKFRRQQPLLNYIVDFYCHELKLIIEIDGEIHSLSENNSYDLKREKLLKINGYHILRLTNSEIFEDLDHALEKIRSFIIENLGVT